MALLKGLCVLTYARGQVKRRNIPRVKTKPRDCILRQGNQKPQGETHLRLVREQNDLSRYYNNPSEGALNTSMVNNVLTFMFTCLLSK